MVAEGAAKAASGPENASKQNLRVLLNVLGKLRGRDAEGLAVPNDWRVTPCKRNALSRYKNLQGFCDCW